MQVSTPDCLARSARSSPARLACSAAFSFRSSGSVQATATTVRAASSSVSCANPPRLERKTDSLGRPAVPWTLARTRRRRRIRLCSFVRTVIGSLRPLPDLATHVLAFVPDALALVGLRWARPPNPRGDLADELLVDPTNHDLGRCRNLELDPVRRRHRDRVRVADRELERLSLQAGAIAHALDLEALLEALGDALDHVGDQAPRQPVERAVLAAVGRPL